MALFESLTDLTDWTTGSGLTLTLYTNITIKTMTAAVSHKKAVTGVTVGHSLFTPFIFKQTNKGKNS